MKKTLLDISGKIDPKLVSVYEDMTECCESLGIPFLVVGATARDIILHYGYGATISRATADIDFGVLVPDWSEFYALKQKLLYHGFEETKMLHRLRSANEIFVDIVPFGGVADSDANICWPPAGQSIMSVCGFDDAYCAAETVRLSNKPVLDVLIASPPGMVLLKIVAWLDREVENRVKDAKDLKYLFSNYEVIPRVVDNLFRQPDIMEKYEWDLTLAASHQLGIDSRIIAANDTNRMIVEFLKNKENPKLEILIEDMCERSESNYERNEALLYAFISGFLS